jgi:uncharacterized Zn finger protein
MMPHDVELIWNGGEEVLSRCRVCGVVKPDDWFMSNTNCKGEENESKENKQNS